MELINGDCLEELKKLEDKSIDFFYLDLPYGQTACKWDVKLDHKALWVQLKRLAKNERTPFFFSCTTKFGFELYNTAPKGWFRWDLVWKKNRAAGFLNAYKLPMRKHEMIYCFAKKTPEYDVSSHKELVRNNKKYINSKSEVFDVYNVNKKNCGKVYKDPLPTSDITPPSEEHELVYCFAKKTPEYDVSSHKDYEESGLKNSGTECYGNDKSYIFKSKTHKERLPTSDITPPSEEHELVYCFAKKSPEYDVSSHKEYTEHKAPNSLHSDKLYGKQNDVLSKTHKERLPTSDITPPTDEHELVYCFAKKTPEYDVSSHKEYIEETGRNKLHNIDTYGKKNQKCVNSKTHKDPLPTSDITPPTDEHELVYCFAKKTPEYDVSSHKDFYEQKERENYKLTKVYDKNVVNSKKIKIKVYKEPLPTSDITPPTDEHELVYCFAKKTPEYDVSSHKEYTEQKEYKHLCNGYGKDKTNKCKAKTHKERLPTSDITPSSWCEFKNDEGINHRTAKPVKLMEFLLKYWTKEGDTVCDPTAGSGSMGVACKNMNRKFIGIEKDKDIYDLMCERVKN